MTFSSITFVIFFIIVYSLIFIVDLKLFDNIEDNIRKKTKHIILLLASYVFYGWWDYRFCFLMLLLTVIAWYCSCRIYKGIKKKLHLILGVAAPLIVLGFFKYYNFFVDSFADAFGINSTLTLNIILPVGISFFTFQSMSYTIDVYRSKIKSYDILSVALYVAFFPQLVAGPIVKANEFIPQLNENRKLKISDLSCGIQIFSIGLFKKLVIADNLSVFVDDVFSKPNAFSGASVIAAVIAYSIQIYCDFSGYSDMAIGTAKCFGYEFNRNFDMPYISKNLTEFWKRWHISLSTWLQEYLYIPLGGNRKGKTRTYINLLLTMVIGGLWHGANYTFIFWGLLHGLGLCVHKIWRSITKQKRFGMIGDALSIFITYAFVCICWVFFRAESFDIALDILKKMFVLSDGIVQIFSWLVFSLFVLIVSHIVGVIRSKKKKYDRIHGFYPILDLSRLSSLIIFFTFIGLTLALAYTNANPFIYFQF